MATTTPKRVTRDHYQYAVGPDIEPALEIDSGNEIIFKTLDCFSGAVTDSSQVFHSVAEILAIVPGLNPVTGPVAVRGAEVGDVLTVHGFDKIDAYELLGQVAEVRVHQTLDNWNAVFVKLDKRYLSES